MTALPALAMACAAALVALAALVRAGVTHDLDRAALQMAQSVASDALDLAANLHTLAGLPYVTLPLAGALALALRRRGHRSASLAPLLIVGTVLVELALKLSTDHAQPGPETSRRAVLPLVPSLESPSSFPSGHASRLTFLAALTAMLVSRPAVTLAAVAFVAFTLFARVYVGDHWPTDVVGGAALGLAFALPAAAWVRQSAATARAGSRR